MTRILRKGIGTLGIVVSACTQVGEREMSLVHVCCAAQIQSERTQK